MESVSIEQSSSQSSSSVVVPAAPAQSPEIEAVAVSAQPKRVVLVTGGAGFLGSHVVKAFVEAGFHVRTTVRSKQKIEASGATLFRELGVELFEADLLNEGSFDEACRGAEFVIHTASPFKFSVKDGRKDLIEPAVKGTRNVLRSCAKAPSVKRVVLTSSVAAIMHEEGSHGDHVYTEEDWNDVATAEESPYPRSKYEAEKAAWEFMGMNYKKISFDLVVLNPVGIFGPVLLPVKDEVDVNLSNQLILKVLNSAYPGYANIGFLGIDVRDLAVLHVRAAITPEANGRYICANGEFVPMAQVAALMIHSIPALAGVLVPPTRVLPNALIIVGAVFDPVMSVKAARRMLNNGEPKISNSKCNTELNFTQYRTMEQSFVDTAVSLERLGTPTVVKDARVRQILLDYSLTKDDNGSKK